MLKPRCGLQKNPQPLGKQGKLLSETAFFQQSKPRGQHCISSSKSKIIATTTDTAHVLPSLKNDIIPETLQRLHIRVHFCQSLLTCGKKMLGIFAHVDDFAWGKSCKKNCILIGPTESNDTHFLGPTQKLLPLVVLQLGGPVCSKKSDVSKQQERKKTVFSCTMLIYAIHNI